MTDNTQQQSPLIPAEAVEAAGRIVSSRFRRLDDQAGQVLAREILAAAAPYMLGDVWEAGCEEGLSWNPGYDDKALAANPYRNPRG